MGVSVVDRFGGVSFRTVGIELSLEAEGFFPRLAIEGEDLFDRWQQAEKEFGAHRLDQLTAEIEDEISLAMYRAWLAWQRTGSPAGWDVKPITSLVGLLDDPAFRGFVPDDLESWYFDRLEGLLDRERRKGKSSARRAKRPLGRVSS